MTIKELIKRANKKENYQEACFYIHEQLKKYNFDTREKIINIIEKKYNCKLMY